MKVWDSVLQTKYCEMCVLWHLGHSPVAAGRWKEWLSFDVNEAAVKGLSRGAPGLGARW